MAGAVAYDCSLLRVETFPQMLLQWMWQTQLIAAYCENCHGLGNVDKSAFEDEIIDTHSQKNTLLLYTYVIWLLLGR